MSAVSLRALGFAYKKNLKKRKSRRDSFEIVLVAEFPQSIISPWTGHLPGKGGIKEHSKIIIRNFDISLRTIL